MGKLDTLIQEKQKKQSDEDLRQYSDLGFEPIETGNVDYLADAFATVETSGDTSKEYLQMERPTFDDMKRSGHLDKSARFEDYVRIENGKRSIADKEKYRDLTLKTYNYLQDVFGVESPEEAALYLYRPAYKKKYGSVDKIPEGIGGSFGKDSKSVMLQRQKALRDKGFLAKERPQATFGLTDLNPFKSSEAQAAEVKDEYSDLGFEPVQEDYSDLGFEPENEYSDLGFEPEAELRVPEDPRDNLTFFQKILTSKPAEILDKPTEFFSNVKKSFERGAISAELDQASYLASIGKLDFDKDVKPLIEKQREAVSADPVKGKNVISKALYSVSEMLPAMLAGLTEGAGTGGAAGLAAAGAGLAVPGSSVLTGPAGYALGQTIGTYEYWRRQGVGSEYATLKTNGIDDSIAVPISQIGGALYGAVEFSQVDKLIPGSKEASKRLISDTLKRTIGRMAAKYGLNWAQEVGEEGVQEIVMATSEEVAGKLSGTSNKSNGKVIKDVLMRGWEAAKESALPMLLLMGPGAVSDVKNIAEEEKMKGEVRKEMARRVIEEAKIAEQEEIERQKQEQEAKAKAKEEQDAEQARIKAEKKEAEQKEDLLEYEQWLKNRQPYNRETKEYDVPLHPAEEGKKEAAGLFEIFNSSELKDFRDLIGWESSQPEGTRGQVSREAGEVMGAWGTKSGHSEAMQDVGPKKSFEILNKVINNEPITESEFDKAVNLLKDYRENIKPGIDALDKEIANAKSTLSESETAEVVRSADAEKAISDDELNSIIQKEGFWDAEPTEKQSVEPTEKPSTPPPPSGRVLQPQDFATAEEYVIAKFNEKPEYGMGHRPTYEGMPPSHDLLEGDAIPKDVYEHPEWSVASNGLKDPATRESWNAVKKIRNNPDAEVVVYRATRKKELNSGDWITFSKIYAEDSVEPNSPEKVYSFKIKAKDAVFAGDDINEFGYYPKSKLIQEWEAAQTLDKSLTEEAKKYKSAEEYVASKINSFRGEVYGKEKRFEGLHLSTDKSFASKFGEVGSYSVDASKMLDITDANKIRSLFGDNVAEEFKNGDFWKLKPNSEGFNERAIDSVIKYAKTNGFTGIKYIENYSKGTSPVNYLVIDKSALKDKSQLIQEWEAAQTLDKSLTEEAKKYKSAEEYIASKLPTLLQSVDPNKLVFREAMQNRKNEVAELFPEGEGYFPITAYVSENGKMTILDGHNRASVAIDRGDNIDVVTIPENIYKKALKDGFDEIEISYAMQLKAGESSAADSLEEQFPGAGVAKEGEKVFDKYFSESKSKLSEEWEQAQKEKGAVSSPLSPETKSSSASSTLSFQSTPDQFSARDKKTISSESKDVNKKSQLLSEYEAAKAKKVTDPARVQEIKNGIAEGEMILKSGTSYGRKLSAEELSAVQRSVNNDKAKIGINIIAEPEASFDFTKPGEGVIVTGKGVVSNESEEVLSGTKKELSSAERGSLVSTPRGPMPLWQAPLAVKFRKKGVLTFPAEKVTSPADIAFAFQHLKSNAVEHLYLGAMKGNKVHKVELISIGTINSSQVSLMEFSSLLNEKGVTGFFMVHNHPSGQIKASPQDIMITERAYKLGQKIGKKSFGHIIINDSEFGFIDDGLDVIPYKHQEYAKTRNIALLEKYVEWKEAKDARPTVKSSSDVYEIAKGIDRDPDTGLVFYLDSKNMILSVQAENKKNITPEMIYTQIGNNRAAGFITVGLSIKEFRKIKDFPKTEYSYLDNIEIKPEGKGTYPYSSFAEDGLLEPGGEYKTSETPSTAELKQSEKLGRGRTPHKIEKGASQKIEQSSQSLDNDTINSIISQPPDITDPSAIESDMLGEFRLDEESGLEATRRVIEDYNIRLKAINRAIQEYSGEDVKEQFDLWAMKDMLPRKQGDLIRRIRNEKVEFTKKLVEDGVSVESLDEFLHALHAIERNAQMNKQLAAIGKPPAEGLSGMTDKEAREIIKNSDKKLYKYVPIIQKMNYDLLAFEVEQGMMTPGEVDKLKSMYKYYVPLQRDIENDFTGIGMGTDIRGKEFKRAKGSTKRALSPIGNVFAQKEKATVRALKNQVGQTIVKMVDEYPFLKDLFKVEKEPMAVIAKVQRKAEVDQKFMDELVSFAKGLGLRFFQTKSKLQGGALGLYYPGWKGIERRFATSRETLAHEVGHFIDYKYELKNKFYRNRKATRAVGEEIFQHSKMEVGENANRLAKVEERFANAFSWWLTHRDLAKQSMPLFNDVISGVIEENAELRPILDIKPSPMPSSETIMEDVWGKVFRVGNNVVGTKIDGAQYFITISDQKVADALKNLNLARLPRFMQPLRAALAVWSGFKTRWRPEFLITNFERDLGEAMVNIGVEKSQLGTEGKSLRRSIVKDLFPSQKKIWKYLRGTQDSAVDEFFRLGGDTGHFWTETAKRSEENLLQLEKEIKNAGFEKIKNPVKKALDFVDDLNSMIELGVRFSAYSNLVKRGFSKERAIQSSADLTVNFSRQGEISPLLKAGYGFINPAIQGTSKVFRSIASPVGQKRIAKSIAGLALMGFLVRTMSLMMDDEGDEQIPNWAKNNKIVFAAGGGKQITLWSLPYGFSTFYSLGSNAAEVMFGKKTFGEGMGNVFETAVNSFSPFGTDLNSFIPTLAKPIFEVNQNKGWYGGRVHPEQIYTKTPKPNSQMYFDRTADSFVFISQAINKLTGGNENKSGLVDASPNDLQYLYDQYFGGPFEFVTSTIEAGARGMNGEFDPNETPFVRQFYRQGKPEQFAYSAIYDTLARARRYDISQIEKDRFFRAIKIGQENGFIDQKKANTNIQDFYKAVNLIDGAITSQDAAKKVREMPDEDREKLLRTYSRNTQKTILRGGRPSKEEEEE